MNYQEILKQLRKKPIANDNDFTQKLNFNKNDIEKIIPHRDPFLLIDRITGLNIQNEIIRGIRFINPAESILKGHFPGFPIYPGSLQLEMAGQLGLCLSYFLFNSTTKIENDKKIPTIRATKILGALFLEPLLPDTEAVIIAKKLEYDSFFGTIIGQVISENKICSVSISEVCFLD